MAYWANPFDTKAGFNILESIFRDLYVAPGRDTIIDDDSRVSASNFERNFFGPLRAGGGPGATKLRVINTVYDTYSPEYTQDCGIYRCSKCNRFDYLFNWEFLDLSVYPATSGDGNAEFAKPTADLINEPGGFYGGAGYSIVAHVRCNEVSTCNACGLTFHAPGSDVDSCPDCGAGPAGPSNNDLGMVQAGCGATGAVFHAVPPLTEAQVNNLSLNWRSQNGRSNFVELRRSKSLTVSIPKVVQPSSYRITWAGDNRTSWNGLQGQAFRTLGEAMRWTPKITMDINGRTVEFPISLFGGYSQKASPVHPGIFAFGGASVSISQVAGKPVPYLGGYRSPDHRYGDVDARRGAYTVPGTQETVMLGSTRVPIGSSGGTSRRNRDYHTDILAVDPTSDSYSRPSFDVGQSNLWDGSSRLCDAISNSNRMSLLINGSLVGSTGSYGTYSAKDITGSLPVLRFKTFQKQAGRMINLVNPMMRDIDDSGMLRIAPIMVIADLNAPSILVKNKAEPSGDPPNSCPNDICASIQIKRYEVDCQDSLVDRIVRALDARRGAGTSSTVSADYPFGITDLKDTGISPELKQELLDIGLPIPADAPGSGYSYIVTANRARAGIRMGRGHNPVLRYNGRRPVNAGRVESLDSNWLETVNPSDYDPTLFYVRVGGSGTRRDPSTFVPPRLVPRFGSVQLGQEIIEDPRNQATVSQDKLYLTQIHKVYSIPPRHYDPVSLSFVDTLLCETCLKTSTTGSILVQRQQGGAITNLAIDPNNGVPLSWDHIPRNRAGIEAWMVAAEVAFEGNRIFRTCPDSVRRNPGVDPAEFDNHYYAPDANGIDDFRWPQPMSFVRTSMLPTIPGYGGHDDDGVTIDGVVYPIAIPRSSYLLGPHNSRPANNPLAAAGIGRLQSEANRPLYRQHTLGDGTTQVWVPVMWGVLDEGRMITTEATTLSQRFGGAP